MRVIDAKGMHYTPLNKMIRKLAIEGEDIVINNVMGQRFIGDGLTGKSKITINGVPGGDLGMFMKGPTIIVNGNSDHAPGNTMDDGTIVINGSGGDATAHSMRGGKIFVRDNIGYRGGIHMKQYLDKRPCLVVGGSARSFLGEYMAGGLIILLRLNESGPYEERGLASGIHGGKIFIRGEVGDFTTVAGSKVAPANETEINSITPIIKEFCNWFNFSETEVFNQGFTLITPENSRPFAGKYVWE